MQFDFASFVFGACALVVAVFALAFFLVYRRRRAQRALVRGMLRGLSEVPFEELAQRTIPRDPVLFPRRRASDRRSPREGI